MWFFSRWFRLFHRPGDVSPSPAPAKAGHPAAEPLPPTSPKERRQALRRGGDPVDVFLRNRQVLAVDHGVQDAEGNWVEVALPSGQVLAEPIRGWVKNRSPGGLAVSVSQSVAEGTVLDVRITLAPDTVPWVPVEVKGCHAHAGRWLLHCQYIGTPPADVLALFHKRRADREPGTRWADGGTRSRRIGTSLAFDRRPARTGRPRADTPEKPVP
jgi:hypothetical protein